MEFTEAQVIAELASIFATSDARIIEGIGDDAAVVAPSPHKQVITTDMAVEGVHFRRDWSNAYDIGRKITAANLADIFAMGARPHHLVAAVALTGHESMSWIRELAEGMRDEAQSCGVSIIGGDMARGPCVVISMTAVGEVDVPIVRSGAKMGDHIYLSALPGWSSAGLYLLSNEINVSTLSSSAHAQRALAQFRAPQVRYSDAVALSGAHSMCDVSDGLVVQAEQMAKASGCRFEIDGAQIASQPEFLDLSLLANEVGAYVWDWVATGGEDHVFLATGIGLPGIEIGIVVQGNGCEIKGLQKQPRGFTHF